MNDENKKPVFKALCLSCGTALYQHEIAVQISGETIDFNERIAVQGTSYTLCTECSERVKGYLKNGMKEAIEKRKILSVNLNEMDQDPIMLGS